MRATINRVGKYELKAVLARTALSTVYDGWDADIARRVAIKMMPLSTADDEEAREALGRFKRGAQAAGQLNHPNICAVYDYGETADFAYLVMEFIDGPTLKGLFDKNQKFTMPEISKIVGGILAALQYSHDRKVVHRDMKPANVMFTGSGVVKITDFGIARLEDSEMTQAGMVIGTPAYMSPEQFLGEKIDWRTDIYSTGVLLYHVLTGERPYEGTLATIMHKVLYGAPLLPSRLSTAVTPALDQVVTRAMARKREDRFQSCAEFKAALLAACAATPIAERVIVPPTGPRRSFPQPPADAPPYFSSGDNGARPRRKIWLALAAGVVIAAGGMIAWRFQDKPQAPVNPATDIISADRTSRSDSAAVPVAGTPNTQPAGGPVTQVQPPVGQFAQVQPPGTSNFADASPATPPTRDPAIPELRPGLPPVDKRDTASATFPDDPFRQQFVPRYEQKLPAPSIPEPPKYVPPPEPPVAAVPVNPPPVKTTSEKRLPPPPIPVAKATPAAGTDRRAPQLDSKSGKLNQELASRSPPQTDLSASTTEDSVLAALNRAKGGSRQSPAHEAALALPAVEFPTSIDGRIGLVCQSVSPETAAQYGLDSARGMVVLGVTAGSVAETAGIHPQDVIVKINGQDVHDLRTLSRIAGQTPAGQTAPVAIVRRGSQKLLQLQVDALRR